MVNGTKMDDLKEKFEGVVDEEESRTVSELEAFMTSVGRLFAIDVGTVLVDGMTKLVEGLNKIANDPEVAKNIEKVKAMQARGFKDEKETDDAD